MTAAKVKTVIVTAAPAMLMVAPKGIATLAVAWSTPKRFAKSRLTGILAAELRVKNAVIPLSLRHFKTRGYGFLRMTKPTMNGLMTKATKSIVPTSTAISCAYFSKVSKPA